MTHRIELNQEEMRVLMSRNFSGIVGGFQSFVEKLQNRARYRQHLDMEQEDIERLVRYTQFYSRGGYQDMLKKIFLRSLGPDMGEHLLDEKSKQLNLFSVDV